MSTTPLLSEMPLLPLCEAWRGLSEALARIDGDNEVWDRLYSLCSDVEYAIFAKEAHTAQEVAAKALVIRDFEGDSLGASVHHPAFWADMARVAGQSPISALLMEWRQLQEPDNPEQSERLKEVERQILDAPASTAADFAAKVIVHFMDGDVTTFEDGSNPVLNDARRLAGIGPALKAGAD